MSCTSFTIDPNGDVVIVLRASQHEDANIVTKVPVPAVETTVETTTEDPSLAPEKAPEKAPGETPSETSSEASTETPTKTVYEEPTETATESTVEDDATQNSSTLAEAPTETSTESSAEPFTEAPTETSDETPTETPSATPSIGTTSESNETTTQTVTKNDVEQSSDKHFICSRKHITFASRRAARELTEDKWTLDKDFPLEPLTIVLKIIHGKTRDIPETVTLNLLADIASIVDYLECHDAVTFFGRNWLSRYSTINLLCFMDKTLAQLIHTSFVFENASLFESVTRIAIKSSSQVVPTYNLPIQADVLSAIGSKSSSLLKVLIDGLIDIQTKLLSQKLGCSYGCRSMLLGSLMQAMNVAAIYPPPSPPSQFLILGSVMFSLRSAHSPKYFSSETDGPSSQHSGKWTLTMWPEQRGGKAQPTVEKALPTGPAKTSNLFGPKSTVDATPPTSNIFGPKPTLDAKTNDKSNFFGPKSTLDTKANDKSVPKPTPTSTGFFGSTAAVDPDQPWAIVRHHCCLQDFMNPLLDEVEAKIAGLKLADFARP